MCDFLPSGVITHETAITKKAVMLSFVEAWWAGLYALLFDKAQHDSPFLECLPPLSIINISSKT